ncbi:MAG: nucleotide exchange factor GrpE [Verrucomicrobia bacterium]|nr:nucleotide exchange factor GrpE [Verrucomicrobiota bacterium]
MSEHTAPRINKVPFLAGDALLLAVAAWLALRPGPPLDLLHSALVAACVALAAWLGAWPFMTEFRAAVQFAESNQLACAVEQVQHLQAVGEQVSAATARWQTVQEAADQTAKSAKEIADQIATEARNFTEFMQKAQSAEVRHLQLEVEKLHRAEGDWLQVIVRLLDHTFTLYTAGLRSGQRGLIDELGLFQNACRDAVRRIGLVPFEVKPGAAFDEKLHQLPEGAPPAAGTPVAEMLAPGFTFQGQLLRRALVAIQSTSAEAPSAQTQPGGPG